MISPDNWGAQQQKRQRTSRDFPGGMVFLVLCLTTFCLPNPAKTTKKIKKEQKKIKKDQKRSKEIKKEEGHDLFCQLLRTRFWPNLTLKRRF